MGVPLAPCRSTFSKPRGMRGEQFSRENLLASPPPLGGPGTHVGWASGGGVARGSTWGRGGDVHVAPAPRCPASRIGFGAALLGTGCVSARPAISGGAGAPRPARKVGTARVNFAQSLGLVFFFFLVHWSTAPLDS